MALEISFKFSFLKMCPYYITLNWKILKIENDICPKIRMYVFFSHIPVIECIAVNTKR